MATKRQGSTSSSGSTSKSSPPLGLSRKEAMEKYINLAGRKAKTGGKKEKDRPSHDVNQAMEKQLLISVGRMVYDEEKQRGVSDRSFTPRKVAFHRDTSHASVLEKCKRNVWHDCAEEFQFFLADGSGSCVEPDDFEIDLQDGRQQIVSWTLNNYLKVSNIRFPSRARLYCVKKSFLVPGDGQHDADGGNSPVEMSTSGQMSAFNPPNGYFVVTFGERKKSRYMDKYSFVTGLTQEVIVSYRLEDDSERMYQVRERLAVTPEVQYNVFAENPLHLGFFLSELADGEGKVIYNFILGFDCSTGDVTYREPCEDGTFFSVWSGCYASTSNKMAVMMCVALGGYHSQTKYSWMKDGRDITEDTPLLYCGKEGVYTCTVRGPEGTQETSRQFKVSDTWEGICVALIAEDRCDPDGIPTAMAVDTQVPASTNSEEMEMLKNYLRNSTSQDELKLATVIGRGAFGQVYKAVWRGSIVAAKVIAVAANPKELDNEIQVYKALNHPNLLSLLGVVYQIGSVTLITNLVIGSSLHAVLFDLDKGKKISYQEKIFIVKQVCQALVFMHTSKPPVVHLDLKPANILVADASLHVYLADFGLGQILNTSAAIGTTTMKAGTPQGRKLKGESVGPSCDVYALGGVMTETFTEQPLWPGLSAHTIMFKVAVEGTYPIVKHLPTQIQAIVQHCFTDVNNRKTAWEILCMVLDIMP